MVGSNSGQLADVDGQLDLVAAATVAAGEAGDQLGLAAGGWSIPGVSLTVTEVVASGQLTRSS